MPEHTPEQKESIRILERALGGAYVITEKDFVEKECLEITSIKVDVQVFNKKGQSFETCRFFYNAAGGGLLGRYPGGEGTDKPQGDHNHLW